MEVSSEIMDRVQRGAAWLDEKRPGWLEEISLEQLDVSSISECILGQLGAGSMRAALGMCELQCLCSDCWSEGPMRGFDVIPGQQGTGEDIEYAQLTEAWKLVVSARRVGLVQRLSQHGWLMSRDATEMINPALETALIQDQLAAG